MTAWKQIVLAVVVVAGAAVAWAFLAPGAHETLARWGIELPQTAVSSKAGGQGGQGAPRPGGRGPQTAVVTESVAVATINDRLSAIGTGRAAASVTVNPYTSGRLTEVPVRSGGAVASGDVIARLDSEAEEIAVDRTRMALDDAQAKLDRTKSLRSSNAATNVQVTDAEMALNNARLALRDAELALERRSVRAPISGIVGIVPVEAGNHVTPQTEIVTIDDRSTIKVDFWVPERYAGAITVGAPLTAVPIARPSLTLQGTVSAVDNRIDEQSRTLRVQAEIGNADDSLRAGMSFQVSMRFAGDTYPSVNPLAIQWGTDGAFIWAIQDGKARRTPVRIIQRNTESVLIEADIAAGAPVVIEGVHAIREGAEPLIAGAEPAPPAGRPAASATGGT